MINNDTEPPNFGRGGGFGKNYPMYSSNSLEKEFVV